MNGWLEHEGFPASPDSRYRATLDALDHAVTGLRVRIENARKVPRHGQVDVLNDLHRRVRGMSLLLNEALGERLAPADGHVD